MVVLAPRLITVFVYVFAARLRLLTCSSSVFYVDVEMVQHLNRTASQFHRTGAGASPRDILVSLTSVANRDTLTLSVVIMLSRCF